MVAQRTGPLWSVDQYLVLERAGPVRHEYHGGYVYAMAGGSQTHSQIALNVGASLRMLLRGSGCRVLNADIKVRCSPVDYVYPDVVVTCDERDRVFARDWIEYPVLVVEVLSPSTAAHDRGDKFLGYQSLPSLVEYVLIDYERQEVEVWRRNEYDTSWSANSYHAGDDVPLLSVHAALPMDLIYEESGL